VKIKAEYNQLKLHIKGACAGVDRINNDYVRLQMMFIYTTHRPSVFTIRGKKFKDRR
jgi:hypothetical protein